MSNKDELINHQQMILSYRNEGNYKEAIKSCYEAISVGEKTKQIAFSKMGMLHCGVCHYYVGDHQKALKYMDDYYKLLEVEAEDIDWLNYYNFIFVLYNEIQKYNKASHALDQVIMLATKLGHGNMLSNAYSNYAHIWDYKKEYSKALEYARKAEVEALNFEPYQPLLVIRARLNLIRALINLEVMDRALELIEEVLNDECIKSAQREEVFILDLKGYYYLKTDNNASLICYERAYEKAKELGDIHVIKPIVDTIIKICEENDNLSKGYHFQKIYIDVLEKIREQNIETTAVQMDLQHDLDTIKKQSLEDSLTKIYNRRFFDDYVNSFDMNKDLNVILFDIDNFKEINDTYGHLVGDQIIVHICHIVKECLCNTDYFIRYGGDEFIIFQEDEDIEKAEKMAKRILRKLEKKCFELEGQKIPCTISLGLANNRLKEFSNVQEIVRYADLGLYQAKNEGRNRFVLAY